MTEKVGALLPALSSSDRKTAVKYAGSDFRLVAASITSLDFSEVARPIKTINLMELESRRLRLAAAISVIEIRETGVAVTFATAVFNES